MRFSQDFVPVDKSIHDLKGFDCGKKSMNEFLSRFAYKHSKLGLSRTYVITTADNSIKNKRQVACYFTLAHSTVSKTGVPIDKSLPQYPFPIILLARLAVDSQFQKNKIGTKSLIYALRRARDLNSAGLNVFGLVLDVLDEGALGFYKSFSFFNPFTDDPMRLFVGMETLKSIFIPKIKVSKPEQ